MVAPYTGPFKSTHLFRYATPYTEIIDHGMQSSPEKLISQGKITWVFLIEETGCLAIGGHMCLFELGAWSVLRGILDNTLKEVAQRKNCVEANRPVKGATMGNFNFLIKQTYGDN